MRRFLCLLLAVFTAPGLVSAAVPLSPRLQEAAAAGVGEVECVVVLAEAAQGDGQALAAAEALQARLEPLGAPVLGRFSHLPLLHLRLPAHALPELAAQPGVVGVAPVFLVRALRSEGKGLMNVPAVAAQGLSGRGVGVAVLDTGVDASHSELAPGGSDPSAKTVRLFDAIDNDGNPHDEEGHGTAVAGIVAGSSNGVAPQARVVAVRVLNQEGEGTSAQILAGLNAVLASIAAGNPFNIKVVNMSLGGYDDTDWPPKAGTCDDLSPDFALAFQRLEEAGVLLVVSAGNGGCSGGVAWPACLSRALAVGAVFDDEICALSLPLIGCINYDRSYEKGQCTSRGCTSRTRPDRIACYSDSGDKLGVWAPAACAKTTRLGGGLEDCFDGTSAAAPYVAGVAALLTEAHPGRSPAVLRQALQATGKPLTDDRNGLIRPRVDAAQALTALATACAAPSTPAGLTADPLTTCARQPIALSWAAVSGAAEYRLAVATAPDFANATEITVTGVNILYTPSLAGDGTLYLRVAAVSPCAVASSWSSPVQVQYQARCQGLDHRWVLGGVAGRHAGVGGVIWSSDLSLLNPEAGVATVRLSFISAAGERETTVTVGPGRQLTAREVISSLFGVSEPTVGYLLVESDRPLEAFGRTYARGEAGGRVTTYGQGMLPAVPAEALDGSSLGLLPHLRSDGSFRTNLEFINVGEVAARITVRLVADDGVTVATLDLGELAPRGRVQRTRALPAGVAAAWAEVRVQPAEARVVGFASLVDGSTDDPTTIPLRVRR